MRKKIGLATLLLLLSFFTTQLKAQCPMCKTAIESAMKDKSNMKGRGLNNGILYLLSMPYLVVGIGGVIWYRANRKKQVN